jgi:CubicO group peptidase (beta-lactamase class C family)
MNVTRPLTSLLQPSSYVFGPVLGLAFTLAVPLLPEGIDFGSRCLAQRAAATETYVFPDTVWERIADPASVGFSSEALEVVRAYADSIDTTGLLVVVGGKVLLEYGDVSEVTYVASVRKSILAMLYGSYVEDGTIDLDRTLEELGMDDVGGLLPVEKQATIRHLLTARSGVYHLASNTGDDRARAPARGSQTPGTYMLYNNWDFNAAGAAFELMTGRNIFDVLQTDLAEPLGFRDFHREVHKKGGDLEISQYPSYHMHLSTRDMARLGYLMLRDGNWNGRQIIPAHWVRKISSPVTPPDEMHPPGGGWGIFGYGYMWWTLDDQRIPPDYRGRMHTAQGAFGQFITVIPAVDMVIAHKTAVGLTPDGIDKGMERMVTWGTYSGILERLRKAMLEHS